MRVRVRACVCMCLCVLLLIETNCFLWKQIVSFKGDRKLNIFHNEEPNKPWKLIRLIKIGQEITKLLLFEEFNMADIGAAILNI